MCGRVVQKTPLSEIRSFFETVNPVPNTAPTYNGAPTDNLPIVRLDREVRRFSRSLPLGFDPLLGEGQVDRPALHQRDGRDGRDKAGLPRSLPTPPLFGACGFLLRVAEDPGRQAALCHRPRGRLPDGLHRPMGALEK